MTISASGVLLPTLSFPVNLKSKCVYFIRKIPQIISVENMRQVLVMGDLSTKPIEELNIMVEKIFQPLLMNTQNQDKWPEIMSEDIMSHVETFKNIVHQVNCRDFNLYKLFIQVCNFMCNLTSLLYIFLQIKGTLKRETVLPMPLVINKIYQVMDEFQHSGGEIVDLAAMSAIGSSIIKWFKIINNTLHQISRVPFAGKAQPTPTHEIQFWNARLKDLEHVYDQLRDPRVKKMIDYMKAVGSYFLPCFKSTLMNVIEGICEAKDINLHMKPLSNHIINFDVEDFTETGKYMKPLIHTVALIWANSVYYRDSSKIITLLHEIGNMVIEAASRQLDPGSIFQGDAEEVHEKVDKCIDVVNMFEKAYLYVRENLESYFDDTPIYWTFPHEAPFHRLMDFDERLHSVSSILEVAIAFGKLDRVEIGGMRGNYLTQKCNEINEEFDASFNNFKNIQYDILDPDDWNIVNDEKALNVKCLDLDRRLVTIFIQAIDDCSTLDSLYKFIQVVSHLIERPIIKSEMSSKLIILIKYLNEELDIVKILFDKGIKSIDKYYPPVAGRLWWLYKLKQRIFRHGENFKLLEHEMVRSEEGVHMMGKMSEMLNIINQEKIKTINHWMEVTPMEIDVNIKKSLLLAETDDLISLNFDDRLIAILREIKYLKMLQIENISSDIEEFYSRYEEVFKCIQSLTRIVQWYNHLKMQTIKEEYNLIETEVEKISVMIRRCIEELTWTTDSKYKYSCFSKICIRFLKINFMPTTALTFS